ncbi:MAG: restriction endonuclease [Planctomycetes bacterium]|nr:restriction endonuclease [Planctomycetota bacterium]
MTIPDYQTCMLPLLELAADGQLHPIKDATAVLANRFGLTEEEREERLPSGQMTVIRSRVGWAKSYLCKAGLLELPMRGRFRITERGRQVFAERPERINVTYLRRFPEFVEFVESSRKGSGASSPVKSVVGPSDEPETPNERLHSAHRELRDALANDLLAEIKARTPGFFEQLVVDLLVKMGYGGNQLDAGRSVGKSGDGGIDGVIKEDRLGLDAIYIQAKRWDSNTVGRPEIQKFVGALHGQRAKKGVFITTSTFSAEARAYVSTIDAKVVLIDGTELAGLMIDFGVGVSTTEIYEVKQIDQDYFAED